MQPNCIARRADGSPCTESTFIFDPRRGGMLCKTHAMAPLERMFGPRADLDGKGEMLLRLLALPSAQRHEILEALSPEEREEFMNLAGALWVDETRRERNN